MTETSAFPSRGNNHGNHYNQLQQLRFPDQPNAIVNGAAPLRSWNSLQNQSSIIQCRATIIHTSTMVGPVTRGTNKTQWCTGITNACANIILQLYWGRVEEVSRSITTTTVIFSCSGTYPICATASTINTSVVAERGRKGY